MTNLRIGHGYDVHRLTGGRALILGGVTIPYEKGLLGHSDADVLTHAVMDALLGAAALGDIGKLFPDSADEFAGISSMELLRRVKRCLSDEGYTVVNVDATVLAQAVSVVLAVALLIKKKLPFAITRADFRLNPQCRKFLSIGLPLALQEFLTQLSFLALCAFVNRLGLTASSGYGVASKIVNFAMLIPSALMQSMASFVAQNVGAGNQKRAKQSMLTGIGVGLFFGCAVFALVMLKGDALAGFFSPDAEVVQKGFEYLKGFAPETILTAILFSMLGYFNGNNKTLWVMAQGLIQTLLVRLPFAYVMSIQPNASLTKIGLAAPVSTLVGVLLNVGFYLYLDRKEKRVQRAD